MKTKELMIGDWVNLNFDVDYKTGESIYTPVQVIGINKDGTVDVNCTFDKSESMQGGWDLKLIEPIPITPEILEKNGFYDRSDGFKFNYVIHTNEYQISYYPKTNRFNIYKKGIDPFYDKDKFFCGFKNIVKYVHELQHALKLCGIKKEIVL